MSRLRSLIDSIRSGTWVRTGVWSLADQGLFAGANFVVNVLLARWLPPEGYGAYTVAYTVFLLLGTIHGGYFSEPMLVYGPGRFVKRLEAYLRILLGGQARFSVGVGSVLGAGALGAWASGHLGLAMALGALAIGQAGILFQWQMRSACYIRTQPQLAATTGVLYAGIVLVGAWGLNHVGGLNEASAIGLMAGASLAAATVITLKLKVPLRSPRDSALAADVVDRHRDYGGWAAGTGVLEWYNGFLPFLLLPLWAGLAETGALRALYNLVLPIVHVFHAFAHLLIPVFVRAGQAGQLRRQAFLIGGGIGGLAVVYALLLAVLGVPVLSWLYDGKYDAYANLLWLIGLLPLALAVSNVAQAVLRSQERPQAVFGARAGAAAVASTLGAGLTFVFGVAGALLSNLFAAMTEASLMSLSLRRGGTDIEPTEGPAAEPDPSRQRVLLIAFACGPGRGSEPGQGWQFAHRLAAHHDVTALVYSGFKPVIDQEMAERPVPGLRVVYTRLPFEAARHWQLGVDRSGIREQLHYHLWNLIAGRRAQRLHADEPFDLVHHASFMRYWSPSAGAMVRDVPFLWGPVGGGETAPRAFYSGFSAAGRRSALLRDWVRSLSHRFPSVRRTARNATIALATTDESADRMRQLGAHDVRVAPASVALPPNEIARLGALPHQPGTPGIRFSAAGRLLHWKGYDLALRAFAQAIESDAALFSDASFTILGEGPEHDELARLAGRLGIGHRVHLLGHVPRTECLEVLGDSDVFVHPSFHDSGGYATLEAMAARRPVVALNLGGPGLQITPDTGIAVDAVTPEQVVEDLTRAFRHLAADPERRAQMGTVGRQRVEDRFTWEALIADTLAVYAELLASPAREVAAADVVPTPVSV
ncbi:MAG: glycosyltransferase [Bacteroidota bacterium]